MKHWLGIDIGTSSLKALVIDDAGRSVARHSVSYPERIDGPAGSAEQDPEWWLAAAEEAVAACVSVVGRQPDGIGLSGQVPTLVLATADGRLLRHAMTWQDTRARREAEELATRFGGTEALVGIALPWSPSQLPAKLRWLAGHDPGLLESGALALQPKDLLGLRLTARARSDPWSSKGLVHVGTGAVVSEIVQATGWTDDVLPKMQNPWEIGGLTAEGVFGLSEGIPVSVGWSDALASMLAIGAFHTSRAFLLTGTSQIAGISVPGEAPSIPGLFAVPRSVAPLGVSYGPTQNGGSAMTWLSRLVSRDVGEILELAGSSSANHPVFVPYLDGERAPLWDTDVRGMFAGLDRNHTLADLSRAVCRGVALSAGHVLALAAAATGARVDEVHIAGRATADATWQRIWRETYGADIICHSEPFTSALGAAMLGAAAASGESLSNVAHLVGEGVRSPATSAERDGAASVMAEFLSTSGLASAWASR